MVKVQLPPGTYVLTIGLSSESNNGLLGVVQQISDGRVLVKICETNKILKVKAESLIFPGGIGAFARSGASESEEIEDMIRVTPPELEKAHSLLLKAHQAVGDARIQKQILNEAKQELSEVLKKEGENTPGDLKKQINFMLADICRFENDFAGIVRAIGKHFPTETAEGSNPDEAWNDYPRLGASVLLALQNLAAAIGMGGDERGERALLIGAVQRFRDSPPPRPPLDSLLLNIANVTEHQIGAAEAVSWFRQVSPATLPRPPRRSSNALSRPLGRSRRCDADPVRPGQAVAAVPSCFPVRFRLAQALFKAGSPDAAEALVLAIQETVPGLPSPAPCCNIFLYTKYTHNIT